MQFQNFNNQKLLRKLKKDVFDRALPESTLG